MIEFTIRGQIRGGKNNMLMNRRGQHYPNRKWAVWRDETIREIDRQWGHNANGEPNRFCIPLRVKVLYWAGDRRKRDVPAMIDAIWHCLERGRFIDDDSLLKSVDWEDCGYDKENPRTEITIEAIDEKG